MLPSFAPPQPRVRVLAHVSRGAFLWVVLLLTRYQGRDPTLPGQVALSPKNPVFAARCRSVRPQGDN
jgi:hypothetical protein